MCYERGLEIVFHTLSLLAFELWSKCSICSSSINLEDVFQLKDTKINTIFENGQSVWSLLHSCQGLALNCITSEIGPLKINKKPNIHTQSTTSLLILHVMSLSALLTHTYTILPSWSQGLESHYFQLLSTKMCVCYAILMRMQSYTLLVLFMEILDYLLR